MRRLLFLPVSLLAVLPALAQTFSAPESVEYDAARHRWLVSENGANRIDVYRPGATPALTSFTTGITSGPHGLEILGDTVYACDGGRIRGFDLNTGAQVLNLNLNASFLNGLASDGDHTLFATDFSAKQIYRVNVRAGTFNLMASTAPRTPNGILYDSARNRCVFVTWGANAAVEALSLVDSTITPQQITSLSNIDGITRDHAGNWYVSAWGTNALYRLDPGFTSPPLSVRTGLSNPADIAINAAGDSIAIPNAGSASNVVFFTSTVTGLAASPEKPLLPMQCYPNPAATHCDVRLETALPGATLVLFDAGGRSLRRQPLMGTSARLERGSLPDGFYFVALYNEAGRVRAIQKVAFFD